MGLVTVAACVFGALRAGAGTPSWLELKSTHFTVITNSGEKEGRRIAWQFEQIRAVLVRLWPWAHIDRGRPFAVFAVKDEATLKSLGPQYWEGKRYRPTSFWVGGADKQFIALRTDLPEPDEIGANPYQAAYWCYASSVFDRSFPRRLPLWYSRGVAEVMSNTIVRDTGLHVGRPLRDNVDLIRAHAPIPLGEFLSADESSHWRAQEQDAQLFDAQAWALVHYLMFADKSVHLARVERLNRMLLDGHDSEVAIREAFGEMKPYFDGMRDYSQRSLMAYARIPIQLDTRAESFGTRPLTAGEASVSRGEFLVAMNRGAEARALAAEAAKSDASLPGPWEIEATLADAEDHRAEAEAAYAKAAAAGSKRAHVYYRLAQLQWAPNADKALLQRLAETLEKARSLEPDDANTLSFLADVRTHLGQHAEGLSLATTAVEIEPAKAYHRLAMARALWGLHRTDEAIQAAMAALRAAGSDVERQHAQGFLDFARREVKAHATPAVSDAPTSVTEPSAPAVKVRVDSNAGDFVAACFEKRDDDACGRAAPALEAACGSGQPVACRSLGSLYDGGFGVGKDKSRAAAAYLQGCREGDKASCARLAALEARGQGIARDTAHAVSTLQRLCAEKVEDACVSWALLLAEGPDKAGSAKARELLQAECSRGSGEACRLVKSLPP